MPMVTVQTIKGIMDAERKAMLLKALTDTMVAVEGRGEESFRSSVWVRIEEQEPGHWSLGGTIVTPAMIEARFPAT